ncbi:MAG: MarR family transcriptional regulator [Oscillospiraceae bacterium]|nr:MarR family transcriptional regulator [Oscillospiraceae bacterium]
MLKFVAYNIITEGVIATPIHLGHTFKKLHFLLEQLMNRKLQELDLTSAQGHVIGFLRHAKEPPCARDLEMTFGLSHATVSGILSRMEAKGFIEVRPDPRDRRVKRICLLDKGTACSQSIARHIEECERIIMEDFTGEEMEQFRSYLTRVVQKLEHNVRENQCNREE